MKQNTKDYPSPSLIVKYYLTIQLGINPQNLWRRKHTQQPPMETNIYLLLAIYNIHP